MRLIQTVLSVSLTAGAHAYAADWPNYRGPTYDGHSAETGINTDWTSKPPKTLWKFDFQNGGKRKGYSGMSAVGGTLYAVDHIGEDDVLIAFNLENGKEKWRYAYTAQGDSYGFCRMTPTVHDGKIYVTTFEGHVHCVNAADGKKVWDHAVVADVGGSAPRWGVAASPLVDGDSVIVVGGGPNALIVSMDKRTGQTKWKGGGSDPLGYATPVAATLGEKKQYIVFSAKGLVGVDAAQGNVLWRIPWKTDYDIHASAPIVLPDNRIFFSSGYKRGSAVFKVNQGDLENVWRGKDIMATFSSPILSQGHVFCTSEDGNLVCQNPGNGEVAWKQAGFKRGEMVGIDGHLIVADGAKGAVVLVEMNTKAYVEKGRITPLGKQTWAPLVISDKRLITRNCASLAVIDLQ